MITFILSCRHHLFGIAMGFGFVASHVAFVHCESARADDGLASPSIELATKLDPWVSAFQLKTDSFTITGEGVIPIDGREHSVSLKIARANDAEFEFELQHADYSLSLIRRADVTVLVLPKHRKVFWGTGAVDEKDHLDGRELGRRIVRGTSQLAVPFDMVRVMDAAALAELAVGSHQAKPGDTSDTWRLGGDYSVTFRDLVQPSGALDRELQVVGTDFRGTFKLVNEVVDLYPRAESGTPLDWIQSHWPDFDLQQLPRSELERTMVRGLHRATEVLAPSARLTEPVQKNRRLANGELRWIDGQRVALLFGTPAEIGAAHAELLRAEAMRCIDSVLYGFGFVQTIATGRWFRHDLDRAYAQLKPHIPERHLAETRALAHGLGQDEALLESLNVFPELFHCSGFAVFGSATEGGKLYHGRVLDYMTTIGLQDAATTFVVAPDGQIPFVNVGYAGFTGSVSGMNAEKISLGEMGGKGEGQWAGVPMATLMRRALEECDSLYEVKELWQNSPRTCEYYYIFADGETKTAVGVSATPQSIEFVEPGQSHPLLGEGITDTVVLSAGSRLEELRRRVQELHGRIDAASGQQLMCRPVAMNSNLHNVLFVPEDGELYIANASHTQPAADRPYTRLNFIELVAELRQRRQAQEMTATGAATAATGAATAVTGWQASDTLCMNVQEEGLEDAKQCLTQLGWEPASFEVTLEAVSDKEKRQGVDTIVRFASPLPLGNPVNDLVAMEWYRAQGKGKSTENTNVPAMIVVHESGRGMTVGRLIARGLSKQGVHAFMMQLPSYGLRRIPDDARIESQTMIGGLRQGIADARRAFDAVRVLPGVDSEHVGIQGTSLGGFVVATASGLDGAFHRSIILLAGGDLYSVLANGDRDASRTRQELERNGVTLEEMRQALYTIEPLRLAHRVPATRTWLFSGTHDTVVPPASSKAFVKAAMLPAGQHIEMPADHYSGVVFLPGVIQQMAKIISE